MGLTHVRAKRWTVDEYERLYRAGFIPEKHVELIEGEIVPMAPQDFPHGNAIERTTDVLSEKYRETHFVRVQLPLTLSSTSQPEPDFALVPKAGRGPDSPHPSMADLVLEVSASSLDYDLAEKASIYARYGLPEVWVLDVKRRVLIRHREPTADPEQPFGFRYARVTRHGQDDIVTALFRPEVELEVGALF